jgi:serine/threonine-protein kinase
MSSTPAQKFVCPRCRSSFDDPAHFCRECGADMTHASAIDRAATVETAAITTADRRLTDSNQAWLGKIVDGRYRVLEVIGRGGMGVVYRVEHLRMGKIAAMKVLHRDLASDPDVVNRFEREAAAVSRLHHPHTVQVFDFGSATGALYLIMEYVRGQDLGHIVGRDGPMPWSRAAPLLAQICGALQEAHELGIVHRDLKPENVLITRTTGGRDFAKVLDFGLAKLGNAPKAASNETDRHAIVGTPYFMAPEQIRGDDVDARTDIYSFGALMFELLTGQHLYSGQTAVGVLTKHLTSEPDAPSMRNPKMGIPPQVDYLCKKALAREPGDRWQTAAALGEAIEDIYAETVGSSTDHGTGAGRSKASRGLAGGRLILDHDDAASETGDVRLRRSDIDSYERALRRNRRLAVLVTLLALAGVAVAAALLLYRESPPLTEEREPNDEIAQANKIAPGAPVSGVLGKRHSPTEGDRDTFVVPFQSGSRRVVTVSVTGIPNIDLNLSESDADGHTMTVDEGRIGAGEVMHRRVIDGRLVITIAETMAPDQKYPTENVSDPYTLTVTEEPAGGGEVEPNGTAADANPIGVGDVMRGFLDTRDDVDLLRFTGDDGTYTVDVAGPGLPLEWRVRDGKPQAAGTQQVLLHRGDLIRIARTAGEVQAPAWTVTITK